MKTSQLLDHLHRDKGDLIALFGNARLVKRLNGKFELRGGTAADGAEAREWCSLFMHEAVSACSPPCVNHRPESRRLQPKRA